MSAGWHEEQGQWVRPVDTADTVLQDEAGAALNKTALMKLSSISTADADDQKGSEMDK